MQDNYKELKTASERISGNSHLSEELLHFCIDQFLRRKDFEGIITSGGGRFFIVRIMLNQWASVTSEFFHTYRKYNESLPQEIGDERDEEESYLELANKVKEELAKLSWFDRMLFDTFVQENHTVSSLARATGIPRTSVSLSINRIRKHIKNKLKENEQKN